MDLSLRRFVRPSKKRCMVDIEDGVGAIDR